MKTTVLITGLLIAGSLSAQTKLIAHKSHSGNAASFSEMSGGNFGIDPSRIDTIIRIAPNCIVEINNFGWRDTVYNHPYYTKPGVTLEEIKANYPPYVIFVGFDNPPSKTVKPRKSTPVKKNSLYLLAFLLTGIGSIYTLSPKNAKQGHR